MSLCICRSLHIQGAAAAPAAAAAGLRPAVLGAPDNAADSSNNDRDNTANDNGGK